MAHFQRNSYNHKVPLRGEADLQSAKNRLGAFSAVLILEEFDTSMGLMHALFGWQERRGGGGEGGSEGGRATEANVSPGGRTNSAEELDDLTRAKVSRTIQYDLRLYEFAHALFWQHARQVGLAPAPAGTNR